MGLAILLGVLTMPPLTLRGPQLEELLNAILDAFDVSSLEQLMRLRLNTDLAAVVAADQPMRSIVFDLIEWAQRNGQLEELVEAAHRFNPGNPRLASFYNKYLGGQQPAPPTLPQQTSQKKVVPPLFTQPEILEIDGLLTSAGLVSDDSFQALQGGMNLDFRASLPSSGALKFRLINTLHALNSTGELIGGEVPFETFLANAVYLAKPRPEAAGLETLRKQIRG
jgi:hypothetical protein